MHPQIITRNSTLPGRFHHHVNIDSKLCLSRSLDTTLSNALDPIPNHVPTSSITFVETEHGRMRRIQRGIDKKDLQRARKYGTREPGRDRPDGSSTSKYTYNDIVYIVHDATAEEITSYAVPLPLEPVPLPESAEDIHASTRDKLLSQPSSWTSNTVLVVDVSGSMREGDVWGTRDRLSAIWVSVALDFLAHRLECGAAKTTDMVSIITLEEYPQYVAQYEPTTWTLYNKIVDIYNNKTIRARGHGPFLPALVVAHTLFNYTSNESCAMALLFLSDGKPSDWALSKALPKEEWTTLITTLVESLAKRFGRRLTFTTIGVGDMDNFETLEKMAAGAKDYGAVANFSNPSKTSMAIGGVFTALSSTLTATQTEMTDMDTMKQYRVKSVVQESRTKARQHLYRISQDEFLVYRLQNVKRLVYKEWVDESGRKMNGFEAAPLQHPLARAVAFAKAAFGEGSERFAYRFFELQEDMETIAGPPLVAKESRLLIEEDMKDETARWNFVKKFCKTQQLARRLAHEFNTTLGMTRRVHRSTPRIAFLDCSVYRLTDSNLGELSVLVEEKLDHEKWHKWNTNNGYVEGMKESPNLTEDHIAKAITDLELDMIEEGSEGEDSEDDDDHDDDDVFISASNGRNQLEQYYFSPSEVAQAFSHYTYLATGKKRLVCDLQGVYDENKNILMFSDPVIHYYSKSGRRQVHGRTDKGEKGVGMFFATHNENCGYLCRLVNRRFRRRFNRRHHHRS